MNASKYRISLDVHNAHSNVCLDVKRGDNCRKIYITLTDGGFPYRISEECYAVFAAKKPDKKAVLNDCFIDGDTIIYDLTGQTTATEGVLDCEVRLYGRDDQLITSPSFTLVVNERAVGDDDEIDSSDEFQALDKLLVEAIGAIKSIDASQNVHIGPNKPTNGAIYWLDTSDDDTTEAPDDSGGSGEQEPDTHEVATYTITNKLTNVTSNNSTASAEENASYTATLTAGNGYELDTVTVTMGGTDVTATVYANGVVNITSVTGDVVITATATAASTGSDIDFSAGNVYASTQVASGNATIDFTSNSSPTWDDFMALKTEKLYYCFVPLDQYKKTMTISASYNSDYGSEIIARGVTIAQATSGTSDFVTNAWDKYNESGCVVFEIDVAALRTKVQTMYDDGTLDSAKSKTISIQTASSVSAGSTAYLLYNYNG